MKIPMSLKDDNIIVTVDDEGHVLDMQVWSDDLQEFFDIDLKKTCPDQLKGLHQEIAERLSRSKEECA